MKPSYHLLWSLIIGLALPCVAGAQNPQPAPPQQAHPTVAPPGAPAPPPEQIAPPAQTPLPPKTTLSERLSEQKGTLHPPPVDPGMQAPLPPRGQGTMPVIPPPGTPGGDQRVEPK